jgi:hypothetical protein
MNNNLEHKALLLKILHKLEVIEFLVPEWLSLSELCMNLGVKNNTARSYLLNNYEPTKDYKKEGGKIYVGRDVALSMRRHYVK